MYTLESLANVTGYALCDKLGFGPVAQSVSGGMASHVDGLVGTVLSVGVDLIVVCDKVVAGSRDRRRSGTLGVCEGLDIALCAVSCHAECLKGGGRGECQRRRVLARRCSRSIAIGGVIDGSIGADAEGHGDALGKACACRACRNHRLGHGFFTSRGICAVLMVCGLVDISQVTATDFVVTLMDDNHTRERLACRNFPVPLAIFLGHIVTGPCSSSST